MSAAWVEVRGAGPVGLALALFLVRRGIDSRRIALEPAVAAWSQALPAHLTSRVLAVSEGTCQLLERITALPAAGTIRKVEVSMLGHAGRTRINADDVRTAALGRVMRYGDLLDMLRAVARGLPWAQPASRTRRRTRLALKRPSSSMPRATPATTRRPARSTRLRC